MPRKSKPGEKPKSRPVRLDIELHEDVSEVARNRNENIQDVAREAIRIGLTRLKPSEKKG